MIILTLFILANLFFGALMFLLMCVNPNDPGILGILHRFFYKTVSSKLITLIKLIFGDRVDPLIASVKSYFDKGNHPLFQIIYLILALGGYLSFSIIGISKVMLNDYTSLSHPIVFIVLGFLALWSYYQACRAKPGRVTNENVEQLIQKYKPYYDGLIYKKNNRCKTCGLIKPPRSKHCTVCNVCVPKFDHHCTWTRQCVGQNNFRQFLLYLFWNALWLSVGTVLAFYDTNEYLKRAEYTQVIGIQNIFILNFKTLRLLFHHQTFLAFLLILGVIGSLALVIFLFLQLWLVSKGLTSNERIKKNQYISFFESEIQIANMLRQKFVVGVEKVQYGEKIMTKTEVLDNLEQYKRRKAELEKTFQGTGFWRKIYQILRK